MSGSRYLRIEALAALVLCIGVEVRSADAPAAPPVSRRSSSWISEVLAAELPKYVPRPPTEAVEASTSNEPAVERDGVLNLPTLTVRPVMRESPTDYAFLTAKGRMDLALKTYPGLRIGNLFGLNQGIAMAMQWEEQRVNKINDLSDRVLRVSLDDSAETKETLRLLKAAIQRPR